MLLVWAGPAGAAAGLAFGYLGAGGAIVTLPIAAFAGWIGAQYWLSGDADPDFDLAMVLPGVAAGFGGMWLGRHVPRALSQQVFAGFLVALGVSTVVLR